MKVQDVMTSNVRSCRPEANLAEAARLMWDNDCGILPIVGPGNRIRSVITDRDIAIALGTKNRLASDISVSEVMAEIVATAAPGDDLSSALRTMRTALVRRLPVTDRDGVLCGILSINDLVLWAGTGPTSPSCEEVLGALKGICRHYIARAARV